MTDAERVTQVTYGAGGAALHVSAAQLRVVSGPDTDACCALRLRRVRVGSAPDSDLVLHDERVSRQHLVLQVQDRGYLVQDQRSTNGTYFRGARITEALLGPGAELRLGSTVLRVEPVGACEEQVAPRPTFGGLVGDSPAMQQVFGLLAALASSDVTVLVEGETGTGKELVAEALHRQSPRSAGPLCVIDCGALPASLIESELFGYERGAFTGAESGREGIFERASGGVVFLDELGELPLELQTRLLRVLDQGTIRRVGSAVSRRVDVRVIAATNRDLRGEVAAGSFRRDLYYRLAVVPVRLPPLRERPEDIPALARHFLWRCGCADPAAVLTPEVLRALSARRWPGNVRELRNAVERAVLLADGASLALPAEEERAAAPARHGTPASADDAHADHEAATTRWDQSWLARALPPGYLDRPYKIGKELLVNQFEALYLGRLLARHGRNVSRIADDAGIDRHMVRKLLFKHGLKDEGDASQE